MIITILTLDTFRSVRFAHSHVLSKLADTSLNAYYYTLRTDSCDHSRWSDTTVSKVVKVVPDSLETQPLFLSIDDTMVEKFGKKFELCSKLFDHAAHYNVPIDVDMNFDPNPILWTLENTLIPIRGHQTVPLL